LNIPASGFVELEGGNMRQIKTESDLYPDVEKWLNENHLCFKTVKNTKKLASIA